MRAGTLVLSLVLAAVLAAPAPAGTRLSPEERARADRLASQLRCPVCQNLSVKESPSSVAASFRARIRTLVHAGKSDQEVRDFFVARYGDWILLSPPQRGLSLLVWLIPALVLAAGLLAVALAVGRWTRRARVLAEAGRGRPEELERARRRLAELEQRGGCA